MSPDHRPIDTLVIGAGAAGMMCAAHAAAQGGSVLVIDHAKAPGEKIRISGGGRCNFTNLHAGPENFISGNPHFAKSALNRYTQFDFIDLVSRYGIPYHEKKLGQLFCDTSAKDIIALLLAEMEKTGATLQLETSVASVAKTESGFSVDLSHQGKPQTLACRHVVVACGGKSIPKMGASGYGYQVAEQFGHTVTETRPALVPLTFTDDLSSRFKALSGVAVDAAVSCGPTRFDEALLFTHRGLSGPAILQISSYWRETRPITVSLSPGTDLFAVLKDRRKSQGKKALATVLADFMPRRLAADIAAQPGTGGNLADLNDATLEAVSASVNDWTLHPAGTEGYRTAEVTLGGVDTAGLTSKTMESRTVPGLYFIGEVVDVTGWLGGYNFQWAWSSGWAAGTAIAAR